MIRREFTADDGQRYWSFILQVDHARLSGELAAVWGNAQMVPVICAAAETDRGLATMRDEVLAAITHHDDGWADWERAPTIDAEHQRLPSFMEMSLDEALAIWQRSIFACAEIGPLAAWIVARHFVELRRGSETQSPAATAWVDEMTARCEAWLATWQTIDPRRHTLQLADEAYTWLRLLDVLSLWLCCGGTDPLPFPPEAKTPLPIETPTNFKIVGDVSNNNGANNKRTTVTAQPWPFEVDRLEIVVDGRLVPVGEYRTAEACLASAIPTEHRWLLSPTDA
jgi:hypothetical protein